MYIAYTFLGKISEISFLNVNYYLLGHPNSKLLPEWRLTVWGKMYDSDIWQ